MLRTFPRSLCDAEQQARVCSRIVPLEPTWMRRLFGLCVFGCLLILLDGCQRSVPMAQMVNCSGLSATSLQNYDRLSKEFLNEDTRHPLVNSGGNVVWGTRYYLESLLTAYEATSNPKYIQSFLDSGGWVMQLAQTITVLDVPDPSAPGNTATSPVIEVEGWPTQLGSFSVSVAIPTQGGQTALYAQNLDPSIPTAPIYLQVIQRSDGSLELAWVRYGPVLQSYTVRTLADLYAIASEPLIWDTTLNGGQSLARIKPTGLGLPAPGIYQVNTPIVTIWHEQTGGILLPFAHLLLLAKQHPGLVDEVTQQEWTGKILTIAASYEDHFIPDGYGGLRFHNLFWLPNAVADTDVAMDYMAVEATLRLFLYELTMDPHQLAIAEGLVLHYANSHWGLSSQGWFLLQYWPDIVPWSSRAGAPPGSIWDSLEYDPSTPAPVTDGVFFVDLLHYANFFGLGQDLGLSNNSYVANRETLQQYLWYSSDSSMSGEPLLRYNFPLVNSTTSDAITPSDNPFAGAGFLAPEVADQSFIDANWNWMQKYGQDPKGWPIGYFLRAWARSEAAQQSVCAAM